MKLPIKKKYFDLIKSGDKGWDFRDSHITFVCEETGETLRKEVNRVILTKRSLLSPRLNDNSVFTEEILIGFQLVDIPNEPLDRDIKNPNNYEDIKLKDKMKKEFICKFCGKELVCAEPDGLMCNNLNCYNYGIII